MAVYLDETLKNRIGMRLVNRLGLAIEKREIEAVEVEEVYEMIMPAIDSLSTYEQVVAFFQKLSTAWPFFSEIPREFETYTLVGSSHP